MFQIRGKAIASTAGALLAVIVLCLIVFSLLPLLLFPDAGDLSASSASSESSASSTLSALNAIWSALNQRWLQKVLWFSIYQAGLSTLISIGLGVLIAGALMRQQFWGKQWLLSALALPMVTPVIVMVFALVQVYGANGWLNFLLNGLGLPEIGSIYGLSGILLAHVSFNLPLAVLCLLQSWQLIPNTYYKQSAQLGLSVWQCLLLIEWPLIKKTLLRTALLIFLLCFGSFTVVLTLGGTPNTTTLEVAVYQAIKYTFELRMAGILALIQLAICLLIGIFWLVLGGKESALLPMTAQSNAMQINIRQSQSLFSKGIDYVGIVFLAAIVSLPLLATLVTGLTAQGIGILSDPIYWQALLKSLLIASYCAIITSVTGLLFSYFLTRLRAYQRIGLELISLLGFIVPPVILGAGWFIFLYQWLSVNVYSVGIGLIVGIHVVMTLPYALRMLCPQWQHLHRQNKLMDMLGIRGWSYLRYMVWPQLSSALRKTFVVAFCLSLGDLGAVALFAAPDAPTLPLLIYQLLGKYQVPEAGTVSASLLLVCVLVSLLLLRSAHVNR